MYKKEVLCVEKMYPCLSLCSLQVKRASLVDSRTAVNDVKFAPRHLGLQLVSLLWCINIYIYVYYCTLRQLFVS